MGEVIDFRPRVISLSLSANDRAAIEAKIEELIAVLDELDGDPDLEDGDPAGDPLDIGEHPTDDACELLPTLPVYGVDQSAGPVNEMRAIRDYERAERDRCDAKWGPR